MKDNFAKLWKALSLFSFMLWPWPLLPGRREQGDDLVQAARESAHCRTKRARTQGWDGQSSSSCGNDICFLLHVVNWRQHCREQLGRLRHVPPPTVWGLRWLQGQGHVAVCFCLTLSCCTGTLTFGKKIYWLLPYRCLNLLFWRMLRNDDARFFI